MIVRRWTESDDRTLDEAHAIHREHGSDWRSEPDKHTSFLWEAELLGGHVHVKVRAATRHVSVQVNHSRGLCGTLVMSPIEWLLLRQCLEHGVRESMPLRAWIDGRGECVAPAGLGYEPTGPDHDGQRFMQFTEEGIS